MTFTNKHGQQMDILILVNAVFVLIDGQEVYRAVCNFDPHIAYQEICKLAQEKQGK